MILFRLHEKFICVRNFTNYLLTMWGRQKTQCNRLWLQLLVCVCFLQILERQKQIGTALSSSPLLSESGVLLFLKTAHCNLDRHTPLVNHGSNCAGRYVTVNITYNSHNRSQSPLSGPDETFPHSFALYHPQTSCCALLRYRASLPVFRLWWIHWWNHWKI